MPREGPATLVASTTFWRAPGFLANQLPMMVSVAPQVSARAGTAYISAVSMKLTPRSSERSRMAWALASSTCSPKVMVPRQMGVTCRSLWPSWMVFIGGIGLNVGDGGRTGGQFTGSDASALSPGFQFVSPRALASSCSRSTRRCTLPVVVMGSASMNSISLGYS